MLELIMLFMFTYLVGSVCSAIIVCRVFRLPDPRTQGSMNPGTTNVLRLAGKKYALLVLMADALKGTCPVLLGKALAMPPLYLGLIGLVAVIGHVYPVFFNFKGGKGVATALGVFIGLNLWLGLASILTWLFIAMLSRYSSLAAMVAISLAPGYALFSAQKQACLPLSLIALLILIQHHANIKRLWHGQEPKLNRNPR